MLTKIELRKHIVPEMENAGCSCCHINCQYRDWQECYEHNKMTCNKILDIRYRARYFTSELHEILKLSKTTLKPSHKNYTTG